MRHYIGIVHQEGESAYGVHFPDVPGCFSASDEQSDLLPNAVQALALHLEDADLPKVRTMDDLRRDPDVVSDLAEGAFMIAVPLVRMTGRTAKANVTMDAGLLAMIDSTARERGLTRSSFLADLARREIIGE